MSPSQPMSVRWQPFTARRAIGVERGFIYWLELMAERVGFVPGDPLCVNDLGLFRNAQSSQNHSKLEYQVQNRYSESHRPLAFAVASRWRILRLIRFCGHTFERREAFADFVTSTSPASALRSLSRPAGRAAACRSGCFSRIGRKLLWSANIMRDRLSGH